MRRGTGASEMQDKSPSSALATSSFLPIVAAAFAIAIFLVDTLTSLDIAVAVLYVVVVLMAAIFVQWRGVLLVGLGCMERTIEIRRCSLRSSDYRKREKAVARSSKRCQRR